MRRHSKWSILKYNLLRFSFGGLRLLWRWFMHVECNVVHTWSTFREPSLQRKKGEDNQHIYDPSRPTAIQPTMTIATRNAQLQSPGNSASLVLIKCQLPSNSCLKYCTSYQHVTSEQAWTKTQILFVVVVCRLSFRTIDCFRITSHTEGPS